MPTLDELIAQERKTAEHNYNMYEFECSFYKKLCEKPTPLGVEWIAQNKNNVYIKGFDTSLILSLMDTKVSLVVKVL